MGVTWTAINDGLSGDGLNIYRFLFDPWSSNGTRLTGAYIATKGGIYKTSGLPTPTWTQVLDAAGVEALIGANGGAARTHFTRELVLPINVQNHVGILARKTVAAPAGASRYYYVYSTDGGATWNCNTSYWWQGADTDLWQKGTNGSTFVWPSHKTANTIYLSTATQFLGSFWDWGISKSTDGGNTWVYQGRPTTDCAPYIVIPFADNAGTPYADDTRAWRSDSIPGGGLPMGGGGVEAVQFSTTFPGPFNPTAWTNKGWVAMGGSWLMDICTWDEDYIYVLASTTDPAVYSSNDQAANWTSSGILGGGVNFYALSALPGNPLFCAIAGETAVPVAKVYRTLDGGATWVDATGDLNTVLPGITSMRSIVPDWIKVT